MTDAGFHEKSDDANCSRHNLFDVAAKMKGGVFPIVLHANPFERTEGVSPYAITSTLGGLYFELNVFQKQVEFSLSDTIGLSDLLLSAPSIEFDGGYDKESLSVEVHALGEVFKQDLMIERSLK